MTERPRIAAAAQGEAVVVAELDGARIAEVRASLPALRHRRIRKGIHFP